MKSFIKIQGPPVVKGIKALQKIAIDTPEVCIMDTTISMFKPGDSQDSYVDFFGTMGLPISAERCDSIISKSGESLGDYDFYFDWFKNPSVDELLGLIEKIDKALKASGCRYTITTK